MSTLLVSIVNWNTREALQRCLQSLSDALRDIDARTVVVDNASTDGSADMVAGEFPDVRLMRSDRNLGFAGGHNCVLESADADYVLVLNPDVEITAAAVSRLLAFMDAEPGVAAVSPALTGHDGDVQNHLYRRWPDTAQILLFWTALRPLTSRVPLLRDTLLQHSITGEHPIDVEQLPGAAMLIRTSALARVGLMDPGYFVWWEDVDWSYRARGRGMRLVVLPDVAVRHAGGASFEPWTLEKRVFQFYRAFFRFLASNGLGRLARRVTPIILADLTLKQYVLRLRSGRSAAETLQRTKHEIRSIVAGISHGAVPYFPDAESASDPAPMVHANGDDEHTVQQHAPEDADPIDVIIVNWNGRRFLARCIESVQSSTTPVRVIVVDNASTDGSAAYLRQRYGDIQLIELSENVGYAAGANAGLLETRGRYVFVMNPDVMVAPDHLSILRRRLNDEPGIGAAQGKLYNTAEADFVSGSPASEKLDSAGHVMLRTRMAVDRGQGRADGPRYSQEASIFSACGAALFLRREMLEDIAVDGEVFAGSFFAYKEDVDLGWRARLRGWDVRYVPSAIAWHVRALPLERGAWRRMPVAARRHSWKNHYLLMLRNDRGSDVLRDLPFIAGWELLRVGHALLRDPRVLTAFVDIMRHMRATRSSRRQIAARRMTPTHHMRRWFGGEPIPAPLCGSAVQARGITRVSA